MADLTPETLAEWREVLAEMLNLARGHDYADAKDLARGEDVVDEVFEARAAEKARAEQAEAERETWRDRSCRYAEEADHHERRANLAEAALSRVLADVEAKAAWFEGASIKCASCLSHGYELRALVGDHRKAPTAAEDRPGGPDAGCADSGAGVGPDGGEGA